MPSTVARRPLLDEKLSRQRDTYCVRVIFRKLLNDARRRSLVVFV
jgi:hypothetical protein